MPKFSTVQAYSDSNSNVQTVSYQQATGSSDGKAEKGTFCVVLCCETVGSRFDRNPHSHVPLFSFFLYSLIQSKRKRL